MTGPAEAQPQVAHAEDPFTSSLAGRRLGRYEVLARLASGGMAAVYVARALGVAGFERLFAIKVLHPHLAHEEEFITMFLDEARLAARIRHPNVVPTIDISDTQDAGYFLVMDYIEGDHLGALLQKAFRLGARLPAPVALRTIVDALDGLAAAHNLTDESGQPIRLVHRDISPHNIMVSTDGISCITDFGVAKAEVRLSTTREGQFKGKLAYMAPEHASNGEADRRSDLFSMGIILWECLTGRRLFRAENHAATLNKICLEPIPLPSEVDPGLAPFDPILQKALAREPDERFQSAEEFADAIERSADALGGLANQRAVAKLVREYAAEKIAHDEELIRSAIAEIGLAPDAAASDAPGPVDPSASSLRLGESVAEDAASEGKKRAPVMLIATAALLVVGVGLAVLLLQPTEPDDVTASPLQPATDAPEPEPREPTGEEHRQPPVQAESSDDETSPPTPEASDPQEGQQAEVPAEEPAEPGVASVETSAAREREASAARPKPERERDQAEQARARGDRKAAQQRPRRRAGTPQRRPDPSERVARNQDAEEKQKRPAETQKAKRGSPKEPKSAIDDVLLNPYRQME